MFLKALGPQKPSLVQLVPNFEMSTLLGYLILAQSNCADLGEEAFYRRRCRFHGRADLHAIAWDFFHQLGQPGEAASPSLSVGDLQKGTGSQSEKRFSL
jgi:hypothetical protein